MIPFGSSTTNSQDPSGSIFTKRCQCHLEFGNILSQADVDGITTYQFSPKPDVFAMTNPDNFCYCPEVLHDMKMLTKDNLLHPRWSNAPKWTKLRRMLGTSRTARTRRSNFYPALMACCSCKALMGSQSLCRPRTSSMLMSLFGKPSMVCSLTGRSTSPSSTLSPPQVSI